MKLTYGFLMTQAAQEGYRKVIGCEPERPSDQIRLIEAAQKIDPLIERYETVRKKLFETYGRPHPEGEGVYIFPLLDDGGNPVIDEEATAEARAENSDALTKYVVDDEKFEALVDKLKQLDATEVEVEPVLSLEFLDRNVKGLSTAEVFSIFWLYKEGIKINPYKRYAGQEEAVSSLLTSLMEEENDGKMGN